MNRVIGLTIKGETVFVRFTRNRVNIPPFGVMTADEVADNPAAIKVILEKQLPVFASATEEEYQEYEAEQAKINEESAAIEAQKKEKADPDFAKEVAARKSAEVRVEALEKDLAEAKDFIKKLQEKVAGFQKEPEPKKEAATKAADDKPKKD